MARLRALHCKLDHAKRTLEAADFEVNQRRREVERVENQIETVKHPPPKRGARKRSAWSSTARPGQNPRTGGRRFVFDDQRKTPRFAWAKTIMAVGGTRVGK
jgi:hypothetical protein